MHSQQLRSARDLVVPPDVGMARKQNGGYNGVQTRAETNTSDIQIFIRLAIFQQLLNNKFT